MTNAKVHLGGVMLPSGSPERDDGGVTGPDRRLLQERIEGRVGTADATVELEDTESELR
jgi:hypothetical protein